MYHMYKYRLVASSYAVLYSLFYLVTKVVGVAVCRSEASEKLLCWALKKLALTILFKILHLNRRNRLLRIFFHIFMFCILLLERLSCTILLMGCVWFFILVVDLRSSHSTAGWMLQISKYLTRFLSEWVDSQVNQKPFGFQSRLWGIRKFRLIDWCIRAQVLDLSIDCW